MHSKKSKQSPTAPVLWKDAPNSSEADITEVAAQLAGELQAGHRVLLEGPMGAGKTTFARALLGALGIEQPPEGSPSFAIAHEYWCRRGDVVHMDLYRIKSEGEIEEAGLETYFWERELIAITEWLASWPGFERAVRRSGVCWRVEIAFRPGEEVRRDVRIFRSGPEGSG